MIKGISINLGIAISKDHVIVDGHHRYLASLFAGVELAPRIVPWSLAKEMVDWRSMIIEDADWDSKEAIQRHNQIDAVYNGISVKELVELIK